MRGNAAGTRPVTVEVFLLRAAGGALAYRRCAGALGPDEHPDAAARRLGGVRDDGPLVHSTSWRCEADGGVVLTYAVVPDPGPAAPATPLGAAGIARGERGRPSPASLEPAQVAAHAARHLAFLAEHDPEARDALNDPLLAEALARHAPGLAGRV